MKNFSIHLWLWFAASVAASSIRSRRATCTAAAQGWETLDDVPAINAAIAECGPTGGTILLDSQNSYSIRSRIDLTSCKQCELQIESQLHVTLNDFDFWWAQGSIFRIAGVDGLTIRSLTGKGLIDGHAQPFYNRPVKTRTLNAPHMMHITNSSSNVRISDLTLKNAPLRFFRLDGNSTGLRFNGINIDVHGAYSALSHAGREIFGFELADVSDVVIDTVNMNVGTDSNLETPHSTWPVGVCASFDRGTSNVLVANFVCTHAWRGVVSMQGNAATVNTFPQVTGKDVRDVYVRNLTFDGATAAYSGVAAGYTSSLEKRLDGSLHNVTWDGVTVVEGGALDGPRCNQGCTEAGCWGLCGCCSCTENYAEYCTASDGKSLYSGVTFKDFKGNLTTPANGWGCRGTQTGCDIRYEGWM
ncbi:pectin lyase-like protein [Polyplosphaeria fusca]|uniref:Pectin lyase-like protein n=1 Tax=Polyplosphaeria fusca TaxID=682080 RepID=A0A9P4R6P0_9PLEO|nr:pectin lyase-like protein [Polyplosphaeria fusca]